ncbi:Uracil-DNA glycosylase [Saliniradius amylolyticus]|uniref:Uracil-DNA glycosylase n=1 Tax=Saliniradius amylolyticus TaxID=2183582 RepID=A0A2S2E2R2_9ALTE|nr:hypothetical protein [Saliniradius amylolyticus]AWL11931.1 Uracil-DNA glycosylase [Saliniradius amylolyticus]
MGSKSRSSQNTTNNQQTINHVNDGDFAGAENIVNDESETEIEVSDSGNTDSSVDVEDSNNTTVEDSYNTTTTNKTDVDNDYDQSQNYDDSFNTDNSDNREFDESFNTDNSVNIDNEGELSGNNGTINIVDGGAVQSAEAVAKEAINESIEGNTEVVGDAFDFGKDAISESIEGNTEIVGDAFDFGKESISGNTEIVGDAFDFGKESLSQVGQLAESQSDDLKGLADKAIESTTNAAENITSTAADSIEEVSKNALTEGFGFGGEVIGSLERVTESITESYQEELGEQATKFQETLSQNAAMNATGQNAVLKALGENQTKNNEAITELAKSASLQGQDVVAESSQKMILYVAVALVLITAAVAFGRK